MVYRVYVEKKPDFANEAASVLNEARNLLQIRCGDFHAECGTGGYGFRC